MSSGTSRKQAMRVFERVVGVLRMVFCVWVVISYRRLITHCCLSTSLRVRRKVAPGNTRSNGCGASEQFFFAEDIGGEEEYLRRGVSPGVWFQSGLATTTVAQKLLF